MGAKWPTRSLPCGRASAYCLCPAIPTPRSSAMGTLARLPPSCKNHLAPPFLAEKFARCLSSWLKNCARIGPSGGARTCVVFPNPRYLARADLPLHDKHLRGSRHVETNGLGSLKNHNVGRVTVLSVRFAFILLPCLLFSLSFAAQRRPVLPQIDLPHPYYYRELYLPQLTSGPSSVAWAPDSKEVVYSMAGSLWRQKLDSKEAAQLTDGPGYDYQPDWSPDGKSIVYVSYQKDAMELWLLDVASGKSAQLTIGGAVNVEPRWSPDGKRIVFVSTQFNKRFHIFRADVRDGKLKNIVRLTGETKSELPRYYYSPYDTEINPAWTRDGQEILFVSNQGHIHGTGGFWRMKAEPGETAREIHYEETNWKARPDFSPDGSRMVSSSYRGRQWYQLWVLPGNGGEAFPISYGDWDETYVR